MAATDDAFTMVLARGRAKERAMQKALADKAAGSIMDINPQVVAKYEDELYKEIFDPIDGSVSDKFLLFSCINRIFIIYQVLLLSRCGNKYDLKSKIQVSDADMEGFSEQCRNLVSGIYKTSCKTGEGVPEMFRDIARQLADSNK